MITRPDPEALLVALVLCPGTYSRNRFFSLFADPAFAYVRRRAKLVRGVITELTQTDPARRGRVVSVDENEIAGETNLPPGLVAITYVVPALGLRRTTTVTELELALVGYALVRKTGSSAPLADDDRARVRIEAALERLAPDLALASIGTEGAFQAEDDAFADEPPGQDEKAGICPLPEETPER